MMNSLKNKLTSLIFTCLLSFTSTACDSAETEQPLQLEQKIIKLHNTVDNSYVQVNAEIADEETEHRTGLMFRKELETNNGMLFVWPNSEPRSFWMRNTYIPLDMIFIDNNVVLGTVENAVPHTDTPRNIGAVPANRVLEVPAGFVARNNITAGWMLEE